MRRALLIGLLVAASSVSPAWGWGSGHSTQAQLVLDGLPPVIRDFFSEDLQRRIVQEYCGFPDTARSFDANQLGQEAADELARLKLGFGELHQDLNIAISCVFLNRAFAARDPGRAALWLGSLIHTVGDDGSHLTLLAYLSELRRFRPNLKIADACSDLSQVASEAAGRAQLRQLLAGYTPRVIADDAETAVRRLILLAYEEMDFGSQRQSRLGQTFNAESPSAALDDGRLALAEIGAEGTRQILVAAVTAWEFAHRGLRLPLSADLIEQGRAEAQTFLETKPLEHDSVYAGVLDNRPSGPFTGVVVEPSTFMGRARFGYCGAVLSSQTWLHHTPLRSAGRFPRRRNSAAGGGHRRYAGHDHCRGVPGTGADAARVPSSVPALALRLDQRRAPGLRSPPPG